jgi:histone-lysine N-methyltransferase SETD1
MRRERLQDHRTAAATAGMTTGPYGSRAQLVPYALPASLLRLDKPAAAAAAVSGGSRGDNSLAAAGSRAASRSQRALRGELSTRNTQLLAEAKRRQAGKPPGKSLVLQRSGVHGYGLFAAERIPAGEFVIEYVGEIIRPVLEDIVEARYEAAGQCSSYLFT